MRLQRADLLVEVHEFYEGTRDFLIRRRSGADFIDMNPMELLALRETSRILERLQQEGPRLAIQLEIARLLALCLEYRGNTRHLVVEEFTEDDLRGARLFSGTRTDHARDLAAEQSEQFRMVVAGELPPNGSLPEMFWAAHTGLPWLPEHFDDADLGIFARALYRSLAPSPGETCELEVRGLQSQVHKLWRSHFRLLDIPVDVRRRRPLFSKLMGAAIRLASQVNLWPAKAVILAFLKDAKGAYGPDQFTDEEQFLLELRYGACRALGDINVGLLFGCGPLLAELVNEFAVSRLRGVTKSQRKEVEERLRDYMYLLGELRRRRRVARAAQRKELRDLRADRLPGRRRVHAAGEADRQAENPHAKAASNEERAMLDSLLPFLKKGDANRVRALIEAAGDRRAAATSLGINLKTFSRQLRQTVLPNLRRALKKQRGLLDGGRQDRRESQ